MRTLILWLLLAGLAFSATPYQDTIKGDNGDWQDTYIASGSANSNYGTSEIIVIASTTTTTPATTVTSKGMVRPVTSWSLAATRRLDSARMYYYVKYVSANMGTDYTSFTLRLYRCMKGPWYSEDPTWNQCMSGNNWATAGAGASSGSCTENAGSGTAPDVVTASAPSSCGASAMYSTGSTLYTGNWVSWRCDTLFSRWNKGTSSEYGNIIMPSNTMEPVTTRYDTLIFESSRTMAGHVPYAVIFSTDTTSVTALPMYRQGPLGSEVRVGPGGSSRRVGP